MDPVRVSTMNKLIHARRHERVAHHRPAGFHRTSGPGSGRLGSLVMRTAVVHRLPGRMTRPTCPAPEVRRMVTNAPDRAARGVRLRDVGRAPNVQPWERATEVSR